MFDNKKFDNEKFVIMKCIWDANKPITCQEVMAKLREEYGLDYQDTTVYAYLEKLKMKGFISSYQRGVIFYVAVRSEEEYRNEQLEKMKHLWSKGNSKGMIAGILDAIKGKKIFK